MQSICSGLPIPVVFVTALSETEDKLRAIEAGGDDFLTKPHNRLVLGARVPIVLTSRADPAPVRVASCALALLVAQAARAPS